MEQLSNLSAIIKFLKEFFTLFTIVRIVVIVALLFGANRLRIVSNWTGAIVCIVLALVLSCWIYSDWADIHQWNPSPTQITDKKRLS